MLKHFTPIHKHTNTLKKEIKMNFGVPKEIRPYEFRVGLTPAAVDSLVRNGHKVFVESGAGKHAGFSNENYEKMGAKIVYSSKEAYGRADVVVKVSRPTEEEYDFFVPQQTILSFLHLAVASPDLLTRLKKDQITAIAYETIENEDGNLPVLLTTSEIAGRIAPTIAGGLLSSVIGGRGILLSGVPGTPAAAVVILGAGVLGTNAARTFHNIGAQVTMLDISAQALQKVDAYFGGRVTTMFANPHNIAKVVSFADVLVCTAAVPGGKAPTLVTREMVKTMQRRAIILDLAINSGGNVETSRPTTLEDPHFIEEEIIHYCVPNVPSRVARTGSHSLSNAILPYLLEMGALGIHNAMEKIADLRRGTNTFEGKLVHPLVAAALGKKAEVM